VNGPAGKEPAAEAPAPPPAATEATVTIVGPFQASHAGRVHGPGDTVTVPTEVAAAWQVNGWAVPAD
jgi:hypothetical protein